MTESSRALDGCFHCGEPIPTGSHWQVLIKGQSRQMCCIGCQSIAQAIVDAGATSYYEQRTDLGLDVKTLESLAPWTTLLDDPDWTAQHVRRSEQQSQTTLVIEGLRCGACAWLIEKILIQTPGVISARANATNARLALTWDPHQTSLSAIAEKVSRIGYALLPVGSAPLETSRRQSDRLALRRLFVAGLSSAQIMMYAYPEYLEGGALDGDIRSLMRTASMLITVPVMVYSATPFFESAWRMLRQRRLGMDVPVSLGLWIAFIASMWAWWTNEGEVYFDSVSMFVFLLLGSRWIEGRIRARTSAQRERLATAIPVLAHRISPHPGDVAAWTLRPGDRVRVKSGDRIPADGLLLSPLTDVDNAWLTGESLPVPVRAGERVNEGAINLGPEIELQIETSVADGTLSRLSQLAEQAAADRPNWVNWADRLGARFTAGILLLTASLIGGSIAMNIPMQQWLASVIAVLVVTCPCALSMAGPAAYAAALARLLESGVAISSAQTLEKLTVITDVIFDKTGTLTEPMQSRVVMHWGDPTLWPTALAIAAESRHPIAMAIAHAAHTAHVAQSAQSHQAQTTAPARLETVQQHAGLGVSGLMNGQRVQLGSARFVDPSGAQSKTLSAVPSCTVFLAIDGIVVAGFEILDQPRPEATKTITRLRQDGKAVWCLSGDRRDRVNAFAAQIDLPLAQVLSDATPDAKQSFVRHQQTTGARVLMVGDGLNDAPVLAQADVSIAVKSAAPLARQKADIYLLREGLDGVTQSLFVARQAKRILNQNLAWALAYNIIAIPFAAAGLISPLLASVGMAASSLLVVLNSSRLLKLR